MSPELPDDSAFIKAYGKDAPVKRGDFQTELGLFLDAEAFLCDVNEDRRQDSYLRARFLARSLHAGGTHLIEEHRFLLEKE